MKLFKYFSLICLVFCTNFVFGQSKPDALKEYNNGNYTKAIQICEEELKSNPQNLDSYVVLCWSLVKNKQYTEAELQGTNARKISKYDHRIIEILAEAKYYLGKNNDALELFQEYISLVPTSGSRVGTAYYYVGEIFILKAMYEHADIALTQAVRIEPLKEAWWVRLGYAREMTKSYKESVLAYEKALDLNPSLADAKQGKNRVITHIR